MCAALQCEAVICIKYIGSRSTQVMISESRAALHLCTCGNRATTDGGGVDATTAAAIAAAIATVAMAAAASSEQSEYYMSTRRATKAAVPPPQLATAAHMQCSIMSSPYEASI